MVYDLEFLSYAVEYHEDSKAITERITLSNECAEQIKHIKANKSTKPMLFDPTLDPKSFVPFEEIAKIFFKHSQSIVDRYKMPFFPKVDKAQFSSSFEQRSDSRVSSVSSENIQGSSPFLQSLNEKLVDYIDYNELVAELFLSHGKCQHKIAEYFTKLDPKRNVITCRLVETNRVNEHMKVFKTVNVSNKKKKSSVFKGPNQDRCKKNHSEKDKDVYKNALKCELHPVLSTLYESSPVPFSRNDARSDLFRINFTNIKHGMVAGKLQRVFQMDNIIRESIVEELGSTFIECDKAQVLAEDLYNQQEVLKSNRNLFYNHDDPCYENWKQKQMTLLDTLLANWCCGCKPSIEFNLKDNINYHLQFETLVQKLLKFDLKESEESGKKENISVLAIPSLNLLKEFGLRFGVGKVFRKITILSNMIDCFVYHDWYLSCMEYCLADTIDFLKKEDQCYFIKEKQMMVKALESLHLKLEYCFVKILDLYEKKNLTADGVCVLMILLEQMIKAKYDFKIWGFEDNYDAKGLLTNYIKVAMMHYYSKRKDQAEPTWSTSQLLHCLLKDIRVCFNKFQKIFQNIPEHFERFGDLHTVVVNTLYNEFMKDVQKFFQTDSCAPSVNQDILHLAYRLNKLDQEWGCFVNQSMQVWRESIKVLLPNILQSVSSKLISLALLSIKKDNFSILKLAEVQKTQMRVENPSLNNFKHDPNSSPFTSVKRPANENQQSKKASMLKTASAEIVSGIKKQILDPTCFSSPNSLESDELTVNDIMNELLDQVERINNKVKAPCSASLYSSQGPCAEEQKYDMQELMSECSKKENLSQCVLQDKSMVLNQDIENSFVSENSISNNLDQNNFEPKFCSTLQKSKKEGGKIEKEKCSIPQNGLVMVTSSLSDLLASCLELITFVQSLFLSVYPSNSLQLQPDRVNLLNKLYTSIEFVLKMYTSNLLLLDVCGVESLSEANKNKLKYHIENEISICFKYFTRNDQLGKTIGCRHSIGITDQFSARNGVLDNCIILKKFFEESQRRIEPVTKQMCYRINNVYSLLCIIPILQKISADTLEIPLETILQSKAKKKVLDYCVGGPCKIPTNEPSFLCSELINCEGDLNKVLEIQLMLLVSRVEETFLLLFEDDLWPPEKLLSSNKTSYLLTFLSEQVALLKHSLYNECLQRFVVQLFERIVEMFHGVLNDLLLTPNAQAKIKNLASILEEVINILGVDEGSCKSIRNYQLIIMFHLKLLTKPINELRNIFSTLYSPTGKLLYIVENVNSPLTYEEVILNLRNSLPITFYGKEMCEKLQSNEEWFKVLCKHVECKIDEFEKSMNRIGSHLLFERIITNAQPERNFIYPSVLATNRGEGSFNNPSVYLANYNATISFRSRSSDSSSSEEFVKDYHTQNFSDTFVYKFTPMYETSSEDFFNGALYFIVRNKKEWIEKFVNDIKNLFINLYKHKKTLDVERFLEDYSIPVSKKGCEWFHLKRILTCDYRSECQF